MLRRLVVATLLAGVSLSPQVLAQAGAQELDFTRALPVAAISSPAPVDLQAVRQQLRTPAPRRLANPDRSPILLSLYASTAIMQSLDVHSTLKALDNGAREGNPLMAGLTGNRAAFVATKMAVAAGTIFAARRVAKTNKVAAVITLVAINSAYAYVASHNYRVARGQ